MHKAPACSTPRESHKHRPICKSPRGIHPVSQRHKFRGRMTVVRAFLSPSTVNRDVESSFIRCINITLRAANCTSASFYLISLFRCCCFGVLSGPRVRKTTCALKKTLVWMKDCVLLVKHVGNIFCV
ncbi:hypothetical protein CDAR_443601 [Caerostris darwini]|uniref:Uncharacterized protein n=1 Tax=Caerostris darwini TaxID=1538125 RepID=A0AAV4TR84_9ARAC|nr:hypothetical protein CDAR_443601 [Caerostris darwini]